MGPCMQSSGLRRIDDPADSGCEGSPDRDRAPGLAWQHGWWVAGASPDGIMRFSCSARWDRHLSGDGPQETRQLAGDRGGDDIGRLAGTGELAVARLHSRACAFRAISRIGLGCGLGCAS